MRSLIYPYSTSQLDTTREVAADLAAALIRAGHHATVHTGDPYRWPSLEVVRMVREDASSELPAALIYSDTAGPDDIYEAEQETEAHERLSDAGLCTLDVTPVAVAIYTR